MNIVIAGAGAVGTHLAKMLSRQEHNIMLIDTDQDKLEDLESQIDILSIVGSVYFNRCSERCRSRKMRFIYCCKSSRRSEYQFCYIGQKTRS